jgi:hypothetical protein
MAKSLSRYTQDEIQRVNFGYRKGQQKGQRTLLLSLLQHRFGPLPAHYQERIDKAEGYQLLLWGERLLDAKTLEDIFDV